MFNEYDIKQLEKADCKALDQARLRLFSGFDNFSFDHFTWGQPPEKWVPWHVPNSKLPIDDWLEKRGKTTRANSPKLIDRQKLLGLGIVCPYWVTRELLLWAVISSLLEARKADTGREVDASTCEELAQKAEDIANALDEMICENKFFSAMSQFTDDIDGNIKNNDQIAADTKILFRAYDYEHLAIAVAKLHDLNKLAKKQRSILTKKGPKPDFFKRAFIRHVGTAYFTLIGVAPPPASDVFKGLVQSAWASIGDENSGEISDEYIERTIRHNVADKNWHRWHEGIQVTGFELPEGQNIVRKMLDMRDYDLSRRFLLTSDSATGRQIGLHKMGFDSDDSPFLDDLRTNDPEKFMKILEILNDENKTEQQRIDEATEFLKRDFEN